MLTLSTKVQYLKGVGPKLGQVLASRGIYTLEDLLNYLPRAFEDRRSVRNIASLKVGDIVSLKAQVLKVSSISMGRSSRKMYDIALKDSSGVIHCKFFRVPYKGYFERFKTFDFVKVVGKVTDYRGRIEFHHPDLNEYNPDIETDEDQDQLIPIYSEIEGITSQKMRRLIQMVYEQIDWTFIHESFKDPIVESLRQKYAIVEKWQALKLLHFPDPQDAAAYHEGKTKSHRRLIFEDFFWLEMHLASKKSGLKKEDAKAFLPLDQLAGLTEKAIQSLPFELTGAQKRVLQEIFFDLQRPFPLHRLVQGDVGSGKTAVAFLASVYAKENQVQSCLMAPTEILAEQHFKNAQKIFGEVMNVELLTGKTKTSERKEILSKLISGQIDLLIGTHSLLEDPIVFRELGLVIIDEQHRFGVEQRAALKNKASSPHMLVMTATPIPRTLAMTVYGDLDVSIIDELPPGRTPVQTRVVYESKRPEVLKFMSEQIAKGRQVYFVYPLVEESEKMDLKNATEEYEKLKTQFPNYRLGLIHGKMKSDEKDAVMNQFRNHELDILVSTTVIEVGVDVPNANMMIIEHSERFGLSQLHQLRGRVGRGSAKSFCIMILGYAVSDEAKARTSFMEKTTDGFKIAEFDLEMRGPGEFMGRRQSGIDSFRLANLVRDAAILQEARKAAFEIFQDDPSLSKPEYQPLHQELSRCQALFTDA